MYTSGRRTANLSMLRLYGVSREGPTAEVALVDVNTIRPMDNVRLRSVFRRMLANGESSRVQDGLRDVLHRYRRLRDEGRHTLPDLTGVRLYNVGYRMRGDGANWHQPDRRDLVAEYVEAEPSLVSLVRP